MWRDNVNAQVACAVLLLIGAVVVDNVGASTKYTLLGKNQIEVSESMVKCKNNKFMSVTTEVSGELHEMLTTSTNFSGDKWKRRMLELNSESKDIEGKLVASVFGGPDEEWNVLPLYQSVNKKINARSSQLNWWEEFEKWTREELVKENGGPVHFFLKINYNTRWSGCRPIGFDINAISEAGSGFQGRFVNGPGSGAFAFFHKRP